MAGPASPSGSRQGMPKALIPTIHFYRSVGRWTLCVSTLNHGDQYGQIGSASNSLTFRLTRNPA